MDGRKNVTLVDPLDSLSLYVDHNRDGYGHSPAWPHSVFGPATGAPSIDVHRYPLAASVRTQHTLLDQGDILFIPNRWWHRIFSLPGRNVAYTIQAGLPKPHPAALDRHVGALSSFHLINFVLGWREAGRPRQTAPDQASTDAGGAADDAELASVPSKLSQCLMEPLPPLEANLDGLAVVHSRACDDDAASRTQTDAHERPCERWPTSLDVDPSNTRSVPTFGTSAEVLHQDCGGQEPFWSELNRALEG